MAGQRLRIESEYALLLRLVPRHDHAKDLTALGEERQLGIAQAALERPQVPAGRLLRIVGRREVCEVRGGQSADRGLIVLQRAAIPGCRHAGAARVVASLLQPRRRTQPRIGSGPRVIPLQVHRDQELGDEILRDLRQHVRLGGVLELTTERVRKDRLERVRHLDLEEILLGAIEVQDAAPPAVAPDLPALEQVRRDLLDRPVRGQARQEHQGVLDARPLLRQLQAHLEGQIVVVVTRLVDEDVAGAIERPGPAWQQREAADARHQHGADRERRERRERAPPHRPGPALTGRIHDPAGRSSGRRRRAWLHRRRTRPGRATGAAPSCRARRPSGRRRRCGRPR